MQIDDGAERSVTIIARAGLAEVDELVAALSDRAIEADVVITESAEDIERAVSDAVRAGIGTVAAVGGDGAINLVAAALVEHDDGTALLAVPAGTVNLATQVLGTDSIDGAADAVDAGRTRVVDVGQSNRGVFVLNASAGYDAAVIDDADDHSSARFGRLHFFVAGVRRLRRDRPTAVRVTVDGRHVFDAPAMSVIVMNAGQRVSDSFHVAPDASIDDGVLDVLVVKADTASRFVGVVARLARRIPVPRRDIVRAQGSEIRVQWAQPVPAQRDGDADEPARSFTATCRPSSLRVHHS